MEKLEKRESISHLLDTMHYGKKPERSNCTWLGQLTQPYKEGWL